MRINIIKILIFIMVINFLIADNCYAQQTKEISPKESIKDINGPRLLQKSVDTGVDIKILQEEEQLLRPQSPLAPDNTLSPELPTSPQELITPETQIIPETVPSSQTGIIPRHGLTDGGRFAPQAIQEYLKSQEPPKEVPREKAPEKSKFACPGKPDICGNIIFDITQCDQRIDLKNALEIAMEKNFDIKTIEQRVENNRWIYYQYVTNWLPDITFTQLVRRNTGLFAVSGIIPDTVEETALQTNFNFTFTANIKKYFDLKTARYQYQSQKKNLEYTKNQILRDTATRYYELLESKRNIDILKTNVEQIEEQLRINKEKLKAATGTKFDVLRGEADLARANQSLILAQNQYRFKQAQLANIIGVPVLIQLVPDDKDIKIKEIFKDCFDICKAREVAMLNRPDLKAAIFDIEAAKNHKNAAYSVYVPELVVIAQKAWQGTTNFGVGPNQYFGFLLNWNAGTSLGMYGLTEIKARNALLEETKLNYITRSRNIEESIVRSFFNIIAARSLVDSTWREVLSASESRNISVIRLRSGIGTFIDVFQAQNTYTTANINHLSAVIKYDISQIDLLFEMGVISVNNILYGFDSDCYYKK